MSWKAAKSRWKSQAVDPVDHPKEAESSGSPNLRAFWRLQISRRADADPRCNDHHGDCFTVSRIRLSSAYISCFNKEAGPSGPASVCLWSFLLAARALPGDEQDACRSNHHAGQKLRPRVLSTDSGTVPLPHCLLESLPSISAFGLC